MSLSDIDIVSICANLYGPEPEGYWDYLWPMDGSWSALKRVGDVDVVVWRGSTTLLDWLQDFDHFALPTYDPVLGDCHPGFLAGVRSINEKIDAVTRDKVIITGHSLGAGHAMIHAGLRTVAKKPVSAVVAFGEPRPAFSQLAEILKPVPIRSYRNRHDPVCNVPFNDGLRLLYCHPRDLVAVDAPPPMHDPWAWFADHHIELYEAGVSKLLGTCT